jgi:Spy/CpxP family protein refolding chaperone
MKSKVLFLMLFSLMACLPVIVHAQTAAPTARPTDVPAVHLSRKELMEKLNLTSEQKKALRKNRAAYRKKNAELDGQLKVKKVELESEMEKPDYDEAKLEKIADEIGDLQGTKIKEKIKSELTVEKKILTPQQVEQLKSLQGKETSASGEIL